MSSALMMSPAMMSAITAAMMVAMMLPSIAPNVWRYHRHLRALRTPRAGRRTTLFAAGYLSIWSAIGLALAALPAPRVAPWVTGAVILGAGALQCTRWKANRLLRCREACVPAPAVPKHIISAWAEGCRLGVDCCLSCAAPMTVLAVAGLMDARMMLLITAVITAERIAPAGARIARLTGGAAVIAGSVMCASCWVVIMSLAKDLLQ